MNVDPNKIQAMIEILQSMLVTDDTKDISVSEPQTQQQPQVESSQIFKVNKKDSNGFINKFDTMMEKNMHKEDTIIDRKLQVHPPVARSRSYNPVSVKCRVCGKQENINPQLATHTESDRYKCNRCSSSPG